MNSQITPQELKAKLDSKEEIFILDVREPEEYAFANLGGVNIPLSEIPRRMAEIDDEKPIIVMCHHGIRSANALAYLANQGYENIQNLSGGIDAWALKIDNSMKRY